MKKDAYEKTGKEILDCLPKRMERSNKGTYGKVLCVADRKSVV